MASVVKVPNGWKARWRTPAGKSRSKLFARKTDAEAYITSMEHSKLRGDYVDPAAGRVTFRDFADEWQAGQDWKATSREAWPYIRARLMPLLGDLPLSAVDQLELKRARTTLGLKYARSTTATTMSYASTIMRAAHVAGRIGRDPTLGLRAPKTRVGESDGKVGPEHVPTRAEALAILEAAPKPYRAAIALGLAGLRIGEVLGMDADRLDLPRRQVTVDQQLQRIGGEMVLTSPKAEKVRTITVPNLVAVELRRHVRDHQGEGLLFSGGRGATLRRDYFYKSGWRPALVEAGLPVRRFKFHALRHFCA